MRDIYRTAYKAAGLTFDEAIVPSMEPDSIWAGRIIKALTNSGEFQPDEMSTLIDMLRDAGLIDDGEATTAKESFVPPPETASDAAYDSAIRTRRQRLYDAGSISYDQLRAPINRPRSSAAFDERFPDAARLRG